MKKYCIIIEAWLKYLDILSILLYTQINELNEDDECYDFRRWATDNTPHTLILHRLYLPAITWWYHARSTA